AVAADAPPAGCHHQTPAPEAPEPVSHHCCAFDHHPAALTGLTPDFFGLHDLSYLSSVELPFFACSHLPSRGILIGSSPPGTAPLRIYNRPCLIPVPRSIAERCFAFTRLRAQEESYGSFFCYLRRQLCRSH